MAKKINQEQRAFRTWDILVDYATNKSKITYKKLGEKLGIHHRAVKHALGPILEYCLLNELPPLTILIINQNTMEPGKGFFAAWDIENPEDGFNKVFKFNWKSLPNPFHYTEHGETQEKIINEIIDNPEISEAAYTRVKVRGIVQKIFRMALLRVYDYQCAFCGLSFEESLEASHIIPYALSNNKQRLDIRNGLLLCSTHHKLFDCKLIFVNKKYQIEYAFFNENTADYSEYDKLITIALQGKKIILPKSEKHYPNLKYLEEHRNELNKKSNTLIK